jgi:hypothetical protein
MIEKIRQKVRQNQFEFSQHAVDQSILRQNCSYPSRPLLKIITLYEPNPDLWIDFKLRRIPDVN